MKATPKSSSGYHVNKSAGAKTASTKSNNKPKKSGKRFPKRYIAR